MREGSGSQRSPRRARLAASAATRRRGQPPVPAKQIRRAAQTARVRPLPRFGDWPASPRVQQRRARSPRGPSPLQVPPSPARRIPRPPAPPPTVAALRPPADLAALRPPRQCPEGPPAAPVVGGRELATPCDARLQPPPDRVVDVQPPRRTPTQATLTTLGSSFSTSAPVDMAALACAAAAVTRPGAPPRENGSLKGMLSADPRPGTSDAAPVATGTPTLTATVAQGVTSRSGISALVVSEWDGTTPRERADATLTVAVRTTSTDGTRETRAQRAATAESEFGFPYVTSEARHTTAPEADLEVWRHDVRAHDRQMAMMQARLQVAEADLGLCQAQLQRCLRANERLRIENAALKDVSTNRRGSAAAQDRAATREAVPADPCPFLTNMCAVAAGGGSAHGALLCAASAAAPTQGPSPDEQLVSVPARQLRQLLTVLARVDDDSDLSVSASFASGRSQRRRGKSIGTPGSVRFSEGDVTAAEPPLRLGGDPASPGRLRCSVQPDLDGFSPPEIVSPKQASTVPASPVGERAARDAAPCRQPSGLLTPSSTIIDDERFLRELQAFKLGATATSVTSPQSQYIDPVSELTAARTESAHTVRMRSALQL